MTRNIVLPRIESCSRLDIGHSHGSLALAARHEHAGSLPLRRSLLIAEVLGSLKCDCSEQLQLALEFIEAQPPGIVIYLQQEGRGIGLANKIAAYALQASGSSCIPPAASLGIQ